MGCQEQIFPRRQQPSLSQSFFLLEVHFNLNSTVHTITNLNLTDPQDRSHAPSLFPRQTLASSICCAITWPLSEVKF